MATHSSILTWRIPWTGEPGALQSMGSQRVGHGLATEYTVASYRRILCSWIKSTRKLFLYREPMAIKGTKTNVDRMWRSWKLLVCRWWGWKTVQLLWKIAWQVFKKLSIHLTHDLVIPLLGIYPQGVGSAHSHKNVYANIHRSIIYTCQKLKKPKVHQLRKGLMVWDQPTCWSTTW